MSSILETQVKIRPFAEEDRDRVLILLRLNTPDFFDSTEEKDFLYYLQHERELYFVMENIAGEIVGCGGINFSDKGCTGKISWDIFHPDYQGRSLGTQLLQHRINILAEDKKVEKVTVRTSQLAYRFYEKNGFALGAVVEDYWAKGFHLYNMELKKG